MILQARPVKFRSSILLDAGLVGLIVMFAVAVATWKASHSGHFSWLREDQAGHLGAEYDNIAQAIFQGRGFSNPFREQTGPTAWMAPVLPYLLAAVYRMSDASHDAAVAFMFVIQTLAAFLVGFIVLREARKLRLTWLGMVIALGGYAANFHQMFQKTHDSGWLLIIVSLLWLGSVRWWNRTPSLMKAAGWGVFGGLSALSSPVIGAAWAAVTAGRWLIGSQAIPSNPSSLPSGPVTVYPGMPIGDAANRDSSQAVATAAIGCPPGVPSERSAHRLYAVLLAAAVSMAMITPWTIRNRLALGKWIPIKSNGMYELWQSQCLDDDGVLDFRSLSWQPYANRGRQRQKYATLGEVAYIEKKGAEAREAIVRDPISFVMRVTNRWAAAFIYYRAFRDSDAQRGGGWPILLKRIVFPLPLVGLLLTLILRPVPLEPEVAAAAAIWILVLLPYVLISYSDRYAVPVVGMKMLLVLYGAHSLKQALFGTIVVRRSIRWLRRWCLARFR